MIIKHALSVATRKIGSPDGWEWFRYEMVDDGILKLTGGVPTLTAKGAKKWPKIAACRTSYVTESEATAEQERFERETGKCGVCLGDRQVWAGWSRENGHRHRPCRDCNGTGEVAR